MELLFLAVFVFGESIALHRLFLNIFISFHFIPFLYIEFSANFIYNLDEIKK